MANNSQLESNSTSNESRKLCELRVFELRNELQKRNEDTNGVKAILVSRLSAAIAKEGHNPEEYLFTFETKKNVSTARRTAKMMTKEDVDSDASEVQNDGQEMNDSLNENDISIDESVDQNIVNESTTGKAGYEASDIIEDALQLAVDDELKEEREDMSDIPVVSLNKSCSKVNINTSRNEDDSEKFTEDESGVEDMGALLSPPKPETAPVMVPLTVEDTINMDTSKQRKMATDDVSLIVNVDDTQSDVMDADLDISNISTSASIENENNNNENNTQIKSSNKKTNNDVINNNESKFESGDENSLSNSTKKDDTNNPKDSEKDSSSKSKSSNAQKDNKLKTKDSKNISSGQKVSQNSTNGRNIWVSGLSQSTKASELQMIFSKHGKVVSAKIIKNARMSGSRCYGFITMENSEQVSKCITQLNKTELHGRAISLSRNRPQETPSKVTVSRNKPQLAKKDNNKKASNKSIDSKNESTKESDSKESIKETKTDEKNDENTKSKNTDEKEQNKDNSENSSKERTDNKEKRKPIRAPLKDRGVPFRRPIVPFRRSVPIRRPFIQTRGSSFRGFRRGGFNRGGIRAGMPIKRIDVERNIRERERERQMREERRRREELFRERELEREERIRFEREKERLKFERIKLEREKAEFFRYEKERAKLEREKIEREREELRRRQQSQIPLQHRVDDSRSRSSIVNSTLSKRPFETRDIRGNDPYWEERKRIQQIQRMESPILPPGRQTYVDSSTTAGNRHLSHGYETRNDSYKRGRIDMSLAGGSRSEFDTRRHDSRHGSGHDRDERKSGSTPSGSYYRDSSRGATFPSRDRRISSQREDWKASHDSRRDRYDKPLAGGSAAGFGGNSRSYAGGDSRGWSDRNTNSLNKVSYGSGNVHSMSSGQTWNTSSGDRWTPAIGSSSEARSRGQPSLNTSMLSGTNPSIADLFGSSPMTGIGLNISHSLGGNAGNNSLGTGDRPYLHSNRRF